MAGSVLPHRYLSWMSGLDSIDISRSLLAPGVLLSDGTPCGSCQATRAQYLANKRASLLLRHERRCPLGMVCASPSFRRLEATAPGNRRDLPPRPRTRGGLPRCELKSSDTRLSLPAPRGRSDVS